MPAKAGIQQSLNLDSRSESGMTD